MCGKVHIESMVYLAQCAQMIDAFWNTVYELFDRTGIEYDKGDRFLIFGILNNGTAICREGAGALAIAWRCLYACLTAARYEGTPVRLRGAAHRWISMVYSRVLAEGRKWHIWHRKLRNTSKSKAVPPKKRHRKFIEISETGGYKVNPSLKEVWDLTWGPR